MLIYKIKRNQPLICNCKKIESAVFIEYKNLIFFVFNPCSSKRSLLRRYMVLHWAPIIIISTTRTSSSHHKSPTHHFSSTEKTAASPPPSLTLLQSFSMSQQSSTVRLSPEIIQPSHSHHGSPHHIHWTPLSSTTSNTPSNHHPQHHRQMAHSITNRIGGSYSTWWMKSYARLLSSI